MAFFMPFIPTGCLLTELTHQFTLCSVTSDRPLNPNFIVCTMDRVSWV